MTIQEIILKDIENCKTIQNLFRSRHMYYAIFTAHIKDKQAGRYTQFYTNQ